MKICVFAKKVSDKSRPREKFVVQLAASVKKTYNPGALQGIRAWLQLHLLISLTFRCISSLAISEIPAVSDETT